MRTIRRAVIALVPLFASFIAGGCSSSASSSVRRVCDVGSSKSCTCDSGVRGTSSCDDAGAYGACVCALGAGGSGGSGGTAGAAGNPGSGGVAGGAGTGGSSGDASTDGGVASCVVQMVAGSFDTCTLKSDRSVWCWGAGNAIPSRVDALSDVVELASGTFHKCARKNDGSVWCWGANASGQLGNGANADSPIPGQVTLANGNATFLQITAGGFSSCARASGGSAWCWGANTNGQTGNGASSPFESTPVQVTSVDPSGVVEIIAEGGHTCTRMQNGTLRCWGGNADGALGDGTTDPGPKFSSVELAVLGTGVVRTTGRCALKSDLSLWCWGLNTSGQLGNGTTETKTSPVVVESFGGGISEVTRTYARTCARAADGSAWCWGRNADGSLGDGTFGGQPCPNGQCKPSPVRVSGFTGAAAIAGGVMHVCAAKSDGTTWCWGANNQGQLGDGTKDGDACAPGTCRSSPVQTLLTCP